MERLTSWLLKEPVGVMPILDKWILFFLKIIYLGIRFSIKIALGKKRRDRLFVKRGIHFNDSFGPSFYFMSFLYKFIKFSRLGNPVSLKISVRKYNYKVLCPIKKEEVINMTIREDDIIEHFTPKQGDIVVDIGANIGRYTIIGSKRVGAQGKVVAIEAHPGNFEMLNRNIKLNQLTNVIPLNYAAYSKETKIRLYVPDEESGYTIYHTLMERTGKKFVEVNANTLDYLLQLNQIRQEQVKWIKIDVEGAELDVLKGSTNVLSKSKDIALLIEVHGPANYRPVVEFLSLYDFKIEFEKSHDSGDKHIILRKHGSTIE
ncbi:MAG TPA: FkbM family methyltransferase [Nitrososphaeraceae archaeon]|nr:FkbM family methyltransferase [Nitrososphaeraceae archaeon]